MMSSFRSVLRLSTLMLALTVLACDAGNDPMQASAPTPARDGTIALSDLSGHQIYPLAMAAGQRATVLIFVAAECPICNAYAGEINRLSQTYATRGVRFFLVDVDANLAAASAREHVREYALTPTVLLDPNRVLVKKYAATTTPEVILIDQNGLILYRGRIDDLYIGLGQRRFEARQHDLRNALDAVVAGRPVPRAVTSAVGCAI
jgi:hypothetical protein